MIAITTIYFLSDSNNGSVDIIKDTQTYSKKWRAPQGSELVDIGRIIVENRIKVCGEYEVKEIVGGEYIIACTDDGTNWNYFVVYRYSEKIFRAIDEMESVTNRVPTDTLNVQFMQLEIEIVN